MELWKAPQPQTEITYLAGRLRQLVREKGLRYRDVHITTNQPQVYFPLIARIFKQYGIPAFIDERKALDAHYLVRYLLNALDMVQYGFAYPMVFACLETGLAGLDEDEVVALNLFARAKHLRGTMYFDARYFAPPDENARSRKLEGLRAQQEVALAAHEAFTARFQPFYEDLRACTTVRDFSTQRRSCSMRSTPATQKKAQRSARPTRRSWRRWWICSISWWRRSARCQ